MAIGRLVKCKHTNSSQSYQILICLLCKKAKLKVAKLVSVMHAINMYIIILLWEKQAECSYINNSYQFTIPVVVVPTDIQAAI